MGGVVSEAGVAVWGGLVSEGLVLALWGGGKM